MDAHPEKGPSQFALEIFAQAEPNQASARQLAELHCSLDLGHKVPNQFPEPRRENECADMPSNRPQHSFLVRSFECRSLDNSQADTNSKYQRARKPARPFARIDQRNY